MSYFKGFLLAIVLSKSIQDEKSPGILLHGLTAPRDICLGTCRSQFLPLTYFHIPHGQRAIPFLVIHSWHVRSLRDI